MTDNAGEQGRVEADAAHEVPHVGTTHGLSIAELIEDGRRLLTRKNLLNLIHWMAIGSGIVVSIGTALIVPGSEKIEGYGIAVACISAAQVIHKFVTALDNKHTLTEAVAMTLPALQATTTANKVQKDALVKVIDGVGVKHE